MWPSERVPQIIWLALLLTISSAGYFLWSEGERSLAIADAENAHLSAACSSAGKAAYTDYMSRLASSDVAEYTGSLLTPEFHFNNRRGTCLMHIGWYRGQRYGEEIIDVYANKSLLFTGHTNILNEKGDLDKTSFEEYNCVAGGCQYFDAVSYHRSNKFENAGKSIDFDKFAKKLMRE